MSNSNVPSPSVSLSASQSPSPSGSSTNNNDDSNAIIDKIELGFISTKLSDLILGEKIYVALNPNSKNKDISEFTKFLFRITETNNLKSLYEKIVIPEWQTVIEGAFKIGRSVKDTLKVEQNPNNPDYGFEKYYISVTFKPIIEDEANRTELDKYLETQNVNLSVINFVFWQHPTYNLDDRAVFLGLYGHAYIDKLSAEVQKQKIKTDLTSIMSQDPILTQLVKQEVAGVNSLAEEKKQNKVVNDIIKENKAIKEVIEETNAANDIIKKKVNASVLSVSENPKMDILYGIGIVVVIGIAVIIARGKNKNNVAI